MRNLTIFIITAILLSPHTQAKPIYKTTTSDGRIIYTDNLNNAYQHNQNTQQISIIDNLTSQRTQSQSTLTASVSGNLAYSEQSGVAPEVSSQAELAEIPTSSNSLQYDVSTIHLMNVSSTAISKQGDYKITINKPDNETSYRRPAQMLDIDLSLDQNLKQGDTIVIRLNGKEISRGKQLKQQIATTELNPDKYTLNVTIENRSNHVIAEAQTNFYVVINNPLIQRQRQLKAEQEAYNALPWYKKIAIDIKNKIN